MGSNISFSLPGNLPQNKKSDTSTTNQGNTKVQAGSSKSASSPPDSSRFSALTNDLMQIGGSFGISLDEVGVLIEQREDKTKPGLTAKDANRMHLDKAYNDEVKNTSGKETIGTMSQRLAESRPVKNFLNAISFGGEIRGAVDVNKNNLFDMEDAKYLSGLDKSDGEGVISAKDLEKAEKMDIENSWKPSENKVLGGNSHNLATAFQEINSQHQTKGFMEKMTGPKHHDYAKEGLSYSQLGDFKTELAGLKETPSFTAEKKNQAIDFVGQLQNDRGTFIQVSKKSVDWGDSNASKESYKNDDTLKVYVTDLNKM